MFQILDNLIKNTSEIKSIADSLVKAEKNKSEEIFTERDIDKELDEKNNVTTDNLREKLKEISKDIIVGLKHESITLSFDDVLDLILPGLSVISNNIKKFVKEKILMPAKNLFLNTLKKSITKFVLLIAFPFKKVFKFAKEKIGIKEKSEVEKKKNDAIAEGVYESLSNISSLLSIATSMLGIKLGKSTEKLANIINDPRGRAILAAMYSTIIKTVKGSTDEMTSVLNSVNENISSKTKKIQTELKKTFNIKTKFDFSSSLLSSFGLFLSTKHTLKETIKSFSDKNIIVKDIVDNAISVTNESEKIKDNVNKKEEVRKEILNFTTVMQKLSDEEFERKRNEIFSKLIEIDPSYSNIVKIVSMYDRKEAQNIFQTISVELTKKMNEEKAKKKRKLVFKILQKQNLLRQSSIKKEKSFFSDMWNKIKNILSGPYQVDKQSVKENIEKTRNDVKEISKIRKISNFSFFNKKEIISIKEQITTDQSTKESNISDSMQDKGKKDAGKIEKEKEKDQEKTPCSIKNLFVNAITKVIGLYTRIKGSVNKALQSFTNSITFVLKSMYKFAKKVFLRVFKISKNILIKASSLVIKIISWPFRFASKIIKKIAAKVFTSVTKKTLFSSVKKLLLAVLKPVLKFFTRFVFRAVGATLTSSGFGTAAGIALFILDEKYNISDTIVDKLLDPDTYKVMYNLIVNGFDKLKDILEKSLSFVLDPIINILEIIKKSVFTLLGGSVLLFDPILKLASPFIKHIFGENALNKINDFIDDISTNLTQYEMKNPSNMNLEEKIMYLPNMIFPFKAIYNKVASIISLFRSSKEETQAVNHTETVSKNTNAGIPSSEFDHEEVQKSPVLTQGQVSQPKENNVIERIDYDIPDTSAQEKTSTNTSTVKTNNLVEPYNKTNQKLAEKMPEEPKTKTTPVSSKMPSVISSNIYASVFAFEQYY